MRTTAEHPLYVLRGGWIPAKMLEIGDVLLTRCGMRVPVEGVANSGPVETVYNWQVAEYHTYFLSATAEGAGVWAHNSMYPTDATGRQQLADQLDAAGYKPTQGASKMRKADIEQIADAMTNDADAFWAGVPKHKKVIIGPGGEIMDGHHRVIASVLSGKPIPENQILRFPGPNQRPIFNWIDVLLH